MISKPSVLLLVLFIASCSSVRSVRTGDCGVNQRSCQGVTYYLPKRNVLLSVTRARKPPPEKKKKGDSDKNLTPGPCQDTILVRLQPAEPDLRYQYTAQLQHLIVTHDVLSIGINQRGLLDSRDNLNEDLNHPGPDVINFKIPVDSDACLPEDFAHIYDPTEDISVNLPGIYMNYRINVFVAENARVTEEVNLGRRVGGIVYRRSLPYLFTFEQCDGEDCILRQAAQVMLPNKGSIGILPYKSSAFVRNHYIAEFRDGELIRWEANRPAEVIEIVKVPLELLNTLISAPLRLLSSVGGG